MTLVLTHPDHAVGADLDAWTAAGGGDALRRALDDPDGVLDDLEAGELRGLGGAGFPAHAKWRAARAADGDDRWVIANGNEDEPGTFKDRWLLRNGPHQVIEGLLVAAAVTGAAHAVVYVNPHHPRMGHEVDRAVAQWSTHPLVAELATRLGRPVELTVQRSSGLYVGGEDTAVVAAVEGGFPFPRSKPPYPTSDGVGGAPTVVNNIETLAHVPHLVRHGADWFRDLGIGAATGTKLYPLSGDVQRADLFELPMGTSLRDLVFDHGGGMLGDQPFKAVFTGGPSNTLLTAASLDIALDFDSLVAAGSRLGTGAMIVVSEGTSIVRRVADFVEFFADGSCGQCPPCTLGTLQVARTLRRIDRGLGTATDLASLDDLCALLPGSGRCGLVDGAATLLASSLDRFRPEYEAHLLRR